MSPLRAPERLGESLAGASARPAGPTTAGAVDAAGAAGDGSVCAPGADGPAGAAPPAAAARRDRLPLLLALAGLLLVALAAVTAAPRAAVPAVAGPPELLRGPDLTTLAAYGPQGAHVLGYAHGAAVELRVPVRNDGPLPVTLTAASLPVGPLPLLAVELAEPVRLGGGETGAVVLRGTLGNCRHYHERQVQVYGSLALSGTVLSGTVLGAAVERVVPLDRPVLIHSPMIVGCPDRTLDRGDDGRDAFRTFA